MQQIVTFLMFEGKAEEAMNFYLSLFKNSKVNSIKYHTGGDASLAGKVQLASFSLNGQELMCIDSNAPHKFTFTPSMSLYVKCETDEEIDNLFNKLSAGGQVMMPLASYPFSKKFGWVADRFGVSWQVNLVEKQ